jgi:hypothetical protein
MKLTGVSCIALICLLAAGVALAGPPNLLKNGNFEQGMDTTTGEPVGWHSKIIGVIPIPEYLDPERKKGRTGKYSFKCGCGHIWGNVRPWAYLYCPECARLNVGLEDSGDLYADNETCVEIGSGKSGRGLAYKLPTAIGNNEGVRVVSDLIKAEPGAGYEINFDTRASKSHVRLFVECFREETGDDKATEWVKTLPPKANPLKQTIRLKRVFRKHIDAGTPAAWTHFSETFVAPDRYQFDCMYVSLYAYLPGEAAFDNVVLRKLTPAELATHKKANPGPKDKRLR